MSLLDGPRGTRKDILYKALLTTPRTQNKLAIAIATSADAACICLVGGWLTHVSRYHIL